MNRKFNGLMIMTDLDGTFMGRGTSLVERNLKATEYFKSEGGLFTFATGRTASNLFNIIPNPEKIVNAPLSLSNGSCLYDAEARRSLRDYVMDQPAALEMARFLRQSFPDLGMRISTADDGFLLEPCDEIARQNLRAVPDSEKTLLPLEKWEPGEWYKVVLVGEPERLEQVREACREKYGDTVGADKSGRRLIEFHRKDRTKASMLDTFRELYGTDGQPLCICCVGDFENDIEMLKHADISACPSNASDAVKAISQLCLCSNAEGVIGDLVEYFEQNYDSANPPLARKK